YMNLVQKTAEDSLAANPKNLRALEFYGNFLVQSGNNTEAVRVLEKARELSPNRQNNLYALGIAYLNSNQHEKALEVFKYAYEVAPSNDKARTYYGAALLSAGDLLQPELLEGYSYKDPFIFSVFSQVGYHKELIKILTARINDNPTNYQLKLSLAVAYLLDGQRTKAVEAIKEIQEAVPDFKQQGDYLIKEIQAGRNPIQ